MAYAVWRALKVGIASQKVSVDEALVDDRPDKRIAFLTSEQDAPGACHFSKPLP
jgi:hypothetical protein